MQYRRYGKTGFDVSLFGMGCMRLPVMRRDVERPEVDREKAFEIIRYAADNGVTYFDTAWGYHHKTSEEIVGEALAGGRREKVMIATKQPLAAMPERRDIRRNLEESLKKLRTSRVDAYLVHNISPATWPEVRERRLFDEWRAFKDEGLIRFTGFSYHGGADCFNEILAAYDWDMCQIQQNFMDVDRQACEQGIFRAGEKGCALVIMEPLRGGGLAVPSKAVADLYAAHPVARRPVEWAFRHLIDYPEISCVLSGVTTLEQLKDDIALFSAPDALPGCMSAADKALVARARERYRAVASVPCTGCEYCLPCPNGVAIPSVFSCYNDGMMFENFDQPRRAYSFLTAQKKDAAGCVSCGACEEKCPQKIEVAARLKTAHAKLEGWRE